jgi:hypothetical protein
METANINEVLTLVKADIDLTTKQAAIYLNKSPRTLEKYRIIGGGPPYVKYDRSVRYPVQQLVDWKNARVITSTSKQ